MHEINDLIFIKSILVSAGDKLGWNKNDIYFLNTSTWLAKDTPLYKKVNNNHDELEIIGTITDVYPVDEIYNKVADRNDPPENFHLLTELAVYTYWKDTNRQQTISQLLDDIKANKKYVSMECLHKNFNYALRDENGEIHLVEKNSKTKFLTKYLRKFGGSGKYKDFDIALVPIDFVFSGIGFVYKPANPYSVIFAKNQEENKDLEYIDSRSNVDMERIMELDTVKAELENVKSEKATLETNLANVQVVSQEKDKVISAKDQEIATLKSNLEKVEKEVKELKVEKQVFEKKERDGVRKDMLVKEGYSVEKAQELVATFDSLDDKLFNEIAKLHKPAQDSAKMEDEEECEEDSEDSEDAEDEEASVQLNASVVEKHIKPTQKNTNRSKSMSDISNFISKRLNIKKGESN